jgi:hypothetical protein
MAVGWRNKHPSPKKMKHNADDTFKSKNEQLKSSVQSTHIGPLQFTDTASMNDKNHKSQNCFNFFALGHLNGSLGLLLGWGWRMISLAPEVPFWTLRSPAISTRWTVPGTMFGS